MTLQRLGPASSASVLSSTLNNTMTCGFLQFALVQGEYPFLGNFVGTGWLQMRTLRKRISLQLFALLLLAVGFPHLLLAQCTAQIKKGVVKIRATVDGKTRLGAGVIVKLGKDAAYIVTASHVIQGHSQSQ